MGRLHACARPLLATFSSAEAACDGLCSMADHLADESSELPGSSRQAEAVVASQLQQCGAVDVLLAAACSRASPDDAPAPGCEACFVYDADRMAELVGPLYMERLHSCQSLMSLLR